jgi:hypothetical protein
VSYVRQVSASDRPRIPDPVKRAVRQRCGFGCVICGFPLFEYDHLVPWSEVQEHDPDNLVLLCDRHHKEKTLHLLPVADVEAANANPRNLQTGLSPEYHLHYGGAECEADIGSNIHRWPEMVDGLVTIPLLIDDTPIVMFRLEDGALLLTVQLFNAENELVVQVIDNELVFSAEQWDVEFKGQTLTIRHALRDVFVDMRFEPPARLVIGRGHIWRNGVEVEIQPSKLLASTNSFAGGVAERCQIGIAIGDCPEGMAAGICMPAFGWRAFGAASTEDRVLRIIANAEPAREEGPPDIEAFRRFLDAVDPADFDF